MPTRPATFRPGRGAGSDASRRAAEQDYDRRRRAESPTRALYGTARWQRRRAEQLRIEPLCRMCLADDVITAASVADHVEPHRENVAAFWDGALQSLCGWHHDRIKQSEEATSRRGGAGQKLRPDRA